jgi:hypothetical protein
MQLFPDFPDRRKCLFEFVDTLHRRKGHVNDASHGLRAFCNSAPSRSTSTSAPACSNFFLQLTVISELLHFGTLKFFKSRNVASQPLVSAFSPIT